jgi:hypothetical protein
VVRKLLKQLRPLPKIGSEYVSGVTCDPLGKVDALVGSGIEPNQNTTGRVAHIFYRVSVSLRNVSDISFLQGLHSETSMRAEHRDADPTVDDVLPLVSIGVPMQLPERSWIKIEDHTSDRG